MIIRAAIASNGTKSPQISIEEDGHVLTRCTVLMLEEDALLCLLALFKTIISSAKMVNLHKDHTSPRHGARSTSVVSGTGKCGLPFSQENNPMNFELTILESDV